MKKIKDIEKHGFKVPEGYFEGIEDAVLSRLSEEKLKADISETGFKMPDNYLDSIEDKVFEKIKEEPKVVSIFRSKGFYYVSGIAASLLILFGIIMDRGISVETQEMDYEQVENYLLDQDLDTYELASLLTEEEINQINDEILDDVYEDENIEDYLLENVNLEDIIEQ